VNPFHQAEIGVFSACSGAAVISAATTAAVVEIFMVHPGQHAEQMKKEYSAEPASIFVSGHASLNRGFLKSTKRDSQGLFWRFQPEIARPLQRLMRIIMLITVNTTECRVF
jgi:hypothetical protein